MCKGSRTWTNHWGEVKYKRLGWDGVNVPYSNDKREREETEKTEASIIEGKLLCKIAEAEKKSEEEADKKKLESIYWKQDNNAISFYAPFGEKECVCATIWCKKHCHLKGEPFDAKVEKLIQSADIKNMDIHTFPNIIKQLDAKYFTLFASGSIENLGKDIDRKAFMALNWGRYLTEIVDKNKNKKIRFLIKDVYEGTFLNSNFKYNIPKLSENGVIILSIDASSPEGVLSEALKNENIRGISVIKHEDNKELIDLLKNKTFLPLHNIKNIIDCEDCKEEMLCFEQKERFILIQKYKNRA